MKHLFTGAVGGFLVGAGIIEASIVTGIVSHVDPSAALTVNAVSSIIGGLLAKPHYH